MVKAAVRPESWGLFLGTALFSLLYSGVANNLGSSTCPGGEQNSWAFWCFISKSQHPISDIA